MNSPQTSLDILKSVEQPANTQSEDEIIDIDALSSQELDDLVDQHDIDVPEDWNNWKVEQKREWLNAQYSEEEEPPEPISSSDNSPEPIAEKSTKQVKEKKVKTPANPKMAKSFWREKTLYPIWLKVLKTSMKRTLNI